MKQVTMESVKQRISKLASRGNADYALGLTLNEEFELACLRELVAVTEQRDALMVKEQKPVAYIIQDAEMRSNGNPGFLSYDGSISDEDKNEYEISVTPLYTHPATEAARAALRAEGIQFTANRLLAAYDHGFINKPAKEVADVARMIITAIDELPTATPEDLTDSYSKQSLAEIARQLRESKGEVQS